MAFNLQPCGCKMLSYLVCFGTCGADSVDEHEMDPLLQRAQAYGVTAPTSRQPMEHWPSGKRYFTLEGSSITVLGYDVPWETKNKLQKILVRRHVVARATTETGDTSRKLDAGDRRRDAWGMAQLALAGAIPEDTLFRYPGRGATFVLRPETRSAVPLQWLRIGPGAIPDRLADTRCGAMSPVDLLCTLNNVLRTEYQLSTNGIRDLITTILRTSHDFGEAYGKVRPWWAKMSSGVTGQRCYSLLQEHEVRNEGWRQAAIQDFSLKRSDIPPRRVWDLFSNRVLPLSTILNPSHVYSKGRYRDLSRNLPPQLWTVSHSWVPQADMQMVSTLINGKQWRVPIPRATTLEHIRIELLNLGAEYVWLDVLCLRQRDRLEDEARRIEEWKIDVPTIGYIYQGSPYGRPCITYFNGLGLALDTCPAALASPQHWFNRVWTLQESLSSWLPGGLSGTPQPGDAALFAGFGSLARLTRDALVPEMMRRLCTNELDRIAGLAYCLRCTTLPLYSEAVAVEDAWQLLLKHISHVWRMDVFLRYTVDVPFAIHPSWKGLVEARPALRDSLVSSLKGNLWLVDKSQLHSAHLWQYYHDAKSFPLCKIVCHNYAAGIARASPRIELEFCFDAEEANVPRLRLSPLELQGILVQGATYKTLRLPIHQEVIWVLVEPLNGAQWWTNTLEVLKWAVVRFSPKDSVRLSEVYRGRGQDAAGRPRATPM